MLTAKQKQFADSYLRGDEPQAAYRAAGYREKNATTGVKRLLASPEVQTYLQAHGVDGASGVADATEVLRYLTQVLRGEYGTDRERLRAAELLGKRQGLFSDKAIEGGATVLIVDDLGG